MFDFLNLPSELPIGLLCVLCLLVAALLFLFVYALVKLWRLEEVIERLEYETHCDMRGKHRRV